jgi:hypothetical protein
VPQPVVDGVAHGMIAFYGTYTVNDGVLTTRIEGSSYPNLIGGERKHTGSHQPPGITRQADRFAS